MAKEDSGSTEVTAAIIERGGKYLVSRRPRGDQNVWEFPGGTLEEGETLSECLQREIAEELGIDVEVGDEVKSVRTSRSGKDLLIHFYECKITAGKPVALGCREFSWLAPKDLVRLPFAAADKEMAKELAEREKGDR
jgi:mutator protein MutT